MSKQVKAYLGNPFGLNIAGAKEAALSTGYAVACRFKLNKAITLTSATNNVLLFIYAKALAADTRLDVALYSDDPEQSPPEPKDWIAWIQDDYIAVATSSAKWYSNTFIGYDPDADEWILDLELTDDYYWFVMIANQDMKLYAIDPHTTDQWARCRDYWNNGFDTPWDSEEETGTTHADAALSVYIQAAQEVGVGHAKADFSAGQAKAYFGRGQAKGFFSKTVGFELGFEDGFERTVYEGKGQAKSDFKSGRAMGYVE